MRAFVDSNVFVYAFDDRDALRQSLAQHLLARQAADRTLVLSIQVLVETYDVLTRKRRAAPADALAAVRLLMRHEVVAPNSAAALRALELAARHGLSAWDSLIVQAALDSACDTLFSEDLQDGRRFGTLQVVNPFRTAAHAQPGPAYKATPAAPA